MKTLTSSADKTTPTYSRCGAADTPRCTSDTDSTAANSYWTRSTATACNHHTTIVSYCTFCPSFLMTISHSRASPLSLYIFYTYKFRVDYGRYIRVQPPAHARTQHRRPLKYLQLGTYACRLVHPVTYQHYSCVAQKAEEDTTCHSHKPVA